MLDWIGLETPMKLQPSLNSIIIDFIILRPIQSLIPIQKKNLIGLDRRNWWMGCDPLTP